MRARIPRAAGLVACVAAALLATQAPAHATPFPGNGDSTFADNDLHTYCYTPGFTTDESVGSYGMWVLGDTTDMDHLFPLDPPTCHFMETDIWWWEADLPGTDRGVRDCWLESPAGICTSSDITLDFAQIDSGAAPVWEDRRKTAVHEVGHSIGLGHDNVSVMRQGEVPDSSLTWRRFSAHDIAHINGRY